MSEARGRAAAPGLLDADRVRVQIAHGSLAGLAGLAAGYASQYAFQASVSRVLGEDSAGVLFGLIALVTIASAVGRLGLDRIGLRAIAILDGQGDRRGLTATVAGLIWTIVGVSSSIGVVLWYWRRGIASVFGAEGEAATVTMCAFAIPALALAVAAGEFLRGMRWVGLSCVVQFVVPYGTAAATLWALQAGTAAGLRAGGLAFTAGTMAAGVLGVIVVLRRARAREGVVAGHQDARPGPATQAGRTATLFTGAFPMLLVSVMTLLMGHVDVLTLGSFSSGRETAHYIAASRTAMVVSFGLSVVAGIMGPTIASSYARGDREQLSVSVVTTARWCLAYAVAVVGVLMALGEKALALFGPSFGDALPAMAVLALAHLVNAGCGTVAFLLMMTGGERTAATILAAVAMAAVPAYGVAVAEGGAMGAAVVTAASLTAWNVLMLGAAERRLRISVRADNVAASIACLGGWGGIRLAASSVGLDESVGVAALLVSIPLLTWKVLLTADDRRCFAGLWRRRLLKRPTPIVA